MNDRKSILGVIVMIALVTAPIAATPILQQLQSAQAAINRVGGDVRIGGVTSLIEEESKKLIRAPVATSGNNVAKQQNRRLGNYF
jgi:hypothetical protein